MICTWQRLRTAIAEATDASSPYATEPRIRNFRLDGEKGIRKVATDGIAAEWSVVVTRLLLLDPLVQVARQNAIVT